MSKFRQRGGALRRRKPRLIDKLAYGASFLLRREEWGAGRKLRRQLEYDDDE